ncbi:MAG: MotB family protein [Beijerinckiaceae bacterium]
MADEKPHELLIIKRYRGSHEDAHGGAWKIAFADFMTAMMALFLVLWLISATNEKAKVSIARYFNPVKLVEMSTMKKGVSDPNENIPANSEQRGEPRLQKSESVPRSNEEPEVPAKEDSDEPTTGAAHQATHNESALFRDPYAVLAEIVAADETTQAASQKAAIASKTENTIDAAEPFKDPFKMIIPDVLPNARDAGKKAEAPFPQTREPAAQRPSPVLASPLSSPHASFPPSPPPALSISHSPPPAASDKGLPEAASPTQQVTSKDGTASQAAHDDNDTGPDDRSQKPGSSIEAEATKLKSEIASEIAKVVSKVGPDKTIPNVEIQASDEGILISLTDQFDYAMFAIGSAEPQARTIQVMDKVAAILKKYPGGIVVRGHTDGRTYKNKSSNYDNWRLSSARAHMAEYMLIRGGLDEKRIEKIEGYADRKLKNATSPFADENRRIEILLRKDRT